MLYNQLIQFAQALGYQVSESLFYQTSCDLLNRKIYLNTTCDLIINKQYNFEMPSNILRLNSLMHEIGHACNEAYIYKTRRPLDCWQPIDHYIEEIKAWKTAEEIAIKINYPYIKKLKDQKQFALKLYRDYLKIQSFNELKSKYIQRKIIEHDLNNKEL